MPSHTCRECGCTDTTACVLATDVTMAPQGTWVRVKPGPVVTCSWVEPDLCSACGGGPRVITEMKLQSVSIDSEPSPYGGILTEGGPRTWSQRLHELADEMAEHNTTPAAITAIEALRHLARHMTGDGSA